MRSQGVHQSRPPGFQLTKRIMSPLNIAAPCHAATTPRQAQRPTRQPADRCCVGRGPAAGTSFPLLVLLWPLAQRVSRDESGDRGDHLTVLPTRQSGLDQALERDRVKLLEPISLKTRELEASELHQRRAAPQLKRLHKQFPRMRRIAAESTLRFAHQPLKPPRVDPLGVDLQHVPRPRAAHRHPTATGAQDLADPRHVHLQRVLRGSRRALAPQLVGQPVKRDSLRRAGQQQRENGSLLSATERKRLATSDDLQRPEGSELHRTPQTLRDKTRLEYTSPEPGRAGQDPARFGRSSNRR